MDTSLRQRQCARVFLLDALDRVLLFKGRYAHRPDGPGHWFTVGGGLEGTEAADEAAWREAVEETGFTDIVLGPKVWLRRLLLPDRRGRPYLSVEHYFVARCEGGEISRAGWTDSEHRFIDAVRWWSVAEIAGSGETIWPADLATRLMPLIAGHYPDPPWRSDETAVPFPNVEA